MRYTEAINYLYSLHKYGIKLGLNNMVKLMSLFENPHDSLPFIHVAGTNGKGSTAAIIAHMLKASGLKVGLFTSPHLVSFTERIRVNDKEITEDEVANLAAEIKEKVSDSIAQGKIQNFSPTFFEVVTAMALLHFKRKKADIAVMEVGMGGRLDATNIITPEVSVITNISYDHCEFLGYTLSEIANEKAGIIKRGIPVVTSLQEPEAMEVIKRKSVAEEAELYVYGKDFLSVLKKEDTSGIYFDYKSSEGFTIHDLYLPLIGEHQMQNASVAIKAVMIALKRLSQVSKVLFQEGNIAKLIRNGLATTRWPGRLEIISEDPPILIDGAHNPGAAIALSNAIAKNFLHKYKKIILVLGIMADKDIKGIMRPLIPLAAEIILTSPNYKRAASAAKLVEAAADLGFPNVHATQSVKDAIEMAIKYSRCRISGPALIVITGSFYTIGEAKEVLGQKGVLTSLRE